MDVGEQRWATPSLGIDFPFVSDLPALVSQLPQAQADFAAIPLAHPRYRRHATGSPSELEPMTRSDRLLPGKTWTQMIVGKISSWIDFRSSDASILKMHEDAFSAEMNWAMHLGISAVIVTNGIQKGDSAEYLARLGRAVSEIAARIATTGCPFGIWITVPVDAFNEWNLFRSICRENMHIGVYLFVSETGEEIPDMHDLIDQWVADVVFGIHISHTCWEEEQQQQEDDADESVFARISLSPFAKEVISKFVPIRTEILIANRGTLERNWNAMVYLRNLFTNEIPPMTFVEMFEAPLRDVLQRPLQPLMDNLMSQTYEVFEKDPIKYKLYEDAVYHTLVEKFRKRKFRRDDSKVFVDDEEIGAREEEIDDVVEGKEGRREDEDDDDEVKEEENESEDADEDVMIEYERVVIMVVGAGRGPLVVRSIAAARRASIPVKVYAVEKNPYAVITLRNLKLEMGWNDDTVEIVSADMRQWDAPEKADILVSELLGSFGDNELSPECLDGAQRFLDPDHGISIPSEYTSFIVPISSSKLYNSALAFGTPAAMETPYVVKIHQVLFLDDLKPCFRFVHPNPWIGEDLKNGDDDEEKEGTELGHPEKEEEGKKDGDRSSGVEPSCLRGTDSSGLTSIPSDHGRYHCMRFTSKRESLLHGFGGFFESVLFKDILMSIHPDTFSPNMISWFPLFFPLERPIHVKKGDTIEVHFWRRMDGGKRVWYEWCVTSPTPSHVHNVNGRSYSIGL
eukprot:TRINITY_DN6337_c0_g1_i1.p1 TRINITY_DN6337_c0_g1~~TRINITY_DN6337_c0_g1_i1.p1  ORF type:complete len:739 (-),score=222.35 TRINITY_DN6337_c0_g1_i1:114-2330(-)